MDKANRSNNLFRFFWLNNFTGLVTLISLISLLSCDNKPFVDNGWKNKMKDLGFSSSPRTLEINGDGVLDIVIGGSGPEFEATNYGVVAFDGSNGEVIWKVPARNQIFGSPIFQDINEDGTKDVFIGGRSAVFYAINGKNGEVLWEFLPDSDTLDLVEDPTLLNFFNPQWVDDINQDGKLDILVSFGGYVKAQADDYERPAGRLMIISGSDGSILRDKEVPDGKETYMSPLIFQPNSHDEKWILFGTGGETIGGAFYKAPLSALIENDTLMAFRLAVDSTKGYIAPPVITDVNQDGVNDYVVCSVQGTVMCFNGINDMLLWQNNSLNDFEVYATPCPGFYVGDDEIPDFFFSMGFAPKSDKKYAVQVMINGANGNITKTDTLGLFSYSSPVSYNFNGKQQEQILLSINEFGPIPNSGFSVPFYTNRLVVYDPHKDQLNNLRQAQLGTNLGATPLITDLDNDGWIDLIYGYMADGEDFYSYQNGVFERIELKVRYNPTIKWAQYMGVDGKGIY